MNSVTFIEEPVPIQAGEPSYIYIGVISTEFVSVSMIFRLDVETSPTMCYFIKAFHLFSTLNTGHGWLNELDSLIT